MERITELKSQDKQELINDELATDAWLYLQEGFSCEQMHVGKSNFPGEKKKRSKKKKDSQEVCMTGKLGASLPCEQIHHHSRD